MAEAGPEPFERAGGWSFVLDSIMGGRALTTDQASAVMGEILDGRATPARVAALLVAWRIKGETVEEVTGLARSMLDHAVPLTLAGDLLDVVGTGGDRLGSINVSTLAALIAAGAGARVCKHGNRAQSSSVGTADVLEALGVVVDLGPEGVAACLERSGMAFCLAPRFHPAMRHAGPVRKDLGVPTIFNFLGPLTNPARAQHRLVGVSDPAMAERMASVLGANGCRRAFVAYADDGLDELSVTSPSTVLDVVGRPDGSFEVGRRRIDPTTLGFPTSTLAELRGGDAAWNAQVIRGVLEGQRGACRDIGVLNAAAALEIYGQAESLEEGVAAACRSLDEGRALTVLEELARASNEVAERPEC